ncbi:FAD-dependent oxidoreductase [Tundrisphaera sp. TA3]|uniref:FAD-dependent oxidoreductase n=1 Tax=Tundrisphaera sp. TA3 TaxID=3435775 RepID=UPI003EB98211
MVPLLAIGDGAGRSDVLVYGGTPGGIAAALAAADDGESVVLVEPTARIGGLTTSGLSHTDFRTFEGLNGPFLDFARRVEADYVARYGRESPQARDCFRGTFGEPSVNLAAFRAMLDEHPRIHLATGARLEGLAMADGGRRIASATLARPDGSTWTVAADAFIDATYEGDLMAKVGVASRVGRESRDEYGEFLAPDVADGQLQAYNFRLIMTQDPANRVMPEAPAGYRRDDFAPVLDWLQGRGIRTVFGYPTGCLFKAQTPPLPNGKYDINDVSKGSIRLSLPGRNLGWPDGSPAERGRIFAEHLRDQVGLLYFLQNDDAVPAAFRDEARGWGWCRDEFEETGHLPPQLYVREARRMVGARVYTQKDVEPAPGDARAVLHTDAIAIGDYGLNCHGTAHEGPRFGGQHSGEFYRSTPPYQIPYGVIVPKEVDNLLVPVAASASHVGFCALRLEPIWMSLGRAAGHAAHLARSEKIAAGSVPVGRLQRRLHRAGSATIYVSDVPREDPEFAIVQAFGTAGGLHGLSGPPRGSIRGKNIHGQYYEAFPAHAADLGRPLDAPLAERWTAIARTLGLPTDGLPQPDGRATRRDWLRAAARNLR